MTPDTLLRLGLPPAIVGVILCVFLWYLFKDMKELVNQHDKELKELRKDMADDRVRNAERFITREEIYIGFNRIEAQIAKLFKPRDE